MCWPGNVAVGKRVLTRVALSIVMVLISVMAIGMEEPRLADAAENRDSTLVTTLLEQGVEVNGRQVDGMTALHWAVHHDDAAMVELLVKSDEIGRASCRERV